MPTAAELVLSGSRGCVGLGSADNPTAAPTDGPAVVDPVLHAVSVILLYLVYSIIRPEKF